MARGGSGCVFGATVLGAGAHMIDTATMASGEIDQLWRVALIEVIDS